MFWPLGCHCVSTLSLPCLSLCAHAHQMAEAVLELFEDSDKEADGIPTIDLIDAKQLGLLDSTLPFGAIQHRLYMLNDFQIVAEHCIALGLYNIGGGLDLCTPPDKVHTFVKGDRVVIATRRYDEGN